MTWVFFYPYTLLRMLFRPLSTLRYVEGEAARDADIAFARTMRPALFLLISIALGSVMAPLDAGQIEQMQSTRVGSMMVNSWFVLMLVRMISFSFFPLAGAVILDALTPGDITRMTLRTPFNLQCYICAPLALIASPALVLLERGGEVTFVVILAALIWFLAMQFVFFRQFGKLGIIASLLLSPAVLLLGVVGMISLVIITMT